MYIKEEYVQKRNTSLSKIVKYLQKQMYEKVCITRNDNILHIEFQRS